MLKSVSYRIPKWHPSSGRWRLRIGFYFTGKGKREEKPYWWPGEANNGTPPPVVIAAAVTKQDEWKKIKAEWPRISYRLQAARPDLDWSVPVWFDRTLLDQYAAGEKAALDYAVEQVVEEQEREAAMDANVAAIWFVRNGLNALMGRLHQPIRHETDPTYHPGYQSVGNSMLEEQRVTALAELRPHAKRLAVKRVTIRQAIVASLAPLQKRVHSGDLEEDHGRQRGDFRWRPARRGQIPLQRLPVHRRDFPFESEGPTRRPRTFPKGVKGITAR